MSDFSPNKSYSPFSRVSPSHQVEAINAEFDPPGNGGDGVGQGDVCQVSTVVYEEVAAVSLNTRLALYRAADVLLLTPVRDGLDLTPFEYVLANTRHDDGDEYTQGTVVR